MDPRLTTQRVDRTTGPIKSIASSVSSALSSIFVCFFVGGIIISAAKYVANIFVNVLLEMDFMFAQF